MWQYWVAGALLSIGAWAKAYQDSIAHHNSQARRGPWWDSAISWQWKYKQPYQPGAQERFWGSTRWFVALTDAWHFFGLIRDNCAIVAFCLVVPATPWWGKVLLFIGLTINRGFIFERIYQHLNKQA